uniref:Uncharacterized protein n=1 Tax=viral metagenome TaxID=1070528 RepID=A0A6H1ZZ33_9ZZZZ
MARGIKRAVAFGLEVQNVDLAASAVESSLIAAGSILNRHMTADAVESSIIANIKTGTIAVYPPDIAAYAIADSVITITGAAANDYFIVGWESTIGAYTESIAMPVVAKAGTNQVTITFFNALNTEGSAAAGVLSYVRIDNLK